MSARQDRDALVDGVVAYNNMTSHIAPTCIWIGPQWLWLGGGGWQWGHRRACWLGAACGTIHRHTPHSHEPQSVWFSQWAIAWQTAASKQLKAHQRHPSLMNAQQKMIRPNSVDAQSPTVRERPMCTCTKSYGAASTACFEFGKIGRPDRIFYSQCRCHQRVER